MEKKTIRKIEILEQEWFIVEEEEREAEKLEMLDFLVKLQEGDEDTFFISLNELREKFGFEANEEGRKKLIETLDELRNIVICESVTFLENGEIRDREIYETIIDEIEFNNSLCDEELIGISLSYTFLDMRRQALKKIDKMIKKMQL